MIIRGANGYEMIDHEPNCSIHTPPDRACTCGIYIPYVFAMQDWSNWMSKSEVEQRQMQADYRATIREELARATYRCEKLDPRLLRLHALQLQFYRQAKGI